MQKTPRLISTQFHCRGQGGGGQVRRNAVAVRPRAAKEDPQRRRALTYALPHLRLRRGAALAAQRRPGFPVQAGREGPRGIPHCNRCPPRPHCATLRRDLSPPPPLPHPRPPLLLASCLGRAPLPPCRCRQAYIAHAHAPSMGGHSVIGVDDRPGRRPAMRYRPTIGRRRRGAWGRGFR